MVEENNMDVNELDLVYEAYDRTDALLELLLEKGIISEEEFEAKLEEVVERNYESEE